MAGITTPGGNVLQVDDQTNMPNGNTGIETGLQDVGNGFLSNVGSTLARGVSNPAFLPAMGMAIQQFHDAGKYTDLGNQAAARADPFGNNNNRQQYIDQLSSLYKDPSQIANTPGYKFALNQALDATQGRLSAMGYGGTGTMADSLAAQASGLASQTWNTEANRLAMLGGAQFDPANAANMQMKGGELSMQAQSNALGAMFYPFGPGSGGTTVNNTNGGGSGNPNASNLQSRLSQAVSSGAISPASAQQLFQRLITSQGNISDGDLQLMHDLGIDTNVDLGGVDNAPGSYDSSGFGGYGNVNSSTGSILDSQDGSPFNSDNLLGAGYNGDSYITDDPGMDMSGFQVNPWG